MILLPTGLLRIESTGDDGLTSHVLAGGEYYSGMIEDEGNSIMLEFLSKGISFLSKYFLLVSIPLFLICLPYGIFRLIKKRDEKKWTLILFGLFFLIPAFYAYSRGFQDVRYLYIFLPIFCIISVYFIQLIEQKIKKPKVFFAGVIISIILISSIFLNFTITDFEMQKEEYEISLIINQIATSVNRDYSSLHYLKWSDMDVLENFPILSTDVKQRDRVEIIFIGNKSENVFLSVSGTVEKEIIDCIKKLKNHCEGFEINISSPNTEGLKIFHNEDKLNNLILEAKKITTKPIFIKLPPWIMNNKERDEYLSLAHTSIQSGAQGLIVANSKPYPFDKLAVGKGGLSGEPLKNDTIRMVSEVRNKIGSKPIIIACGGISDEIDVWNCIAAGANLCQAYTALIYNGPFFAYNINKKLSALMIDKNIESLEKIQGQSMIKKMD